MFKNKNNSIRKISVSGRYSQEWGRWLASLLAGSCLLMGSATAVADIGEQQWQEIFNVDDGAWRMAQFEGAGFRSDGSVLVSGAGNGGIAVRYDAQTGTLLDTPPEWIDFETTPTNHNYFNDHVIDSNGDVYVAGRHNAFDPGTWKYNSSAVLQSGWPKVTTGTGDGLNTGVALDSLGFVYSAGYNNAGWLISKHATSDGSVPSGFPLSYSNGYDGKAGQVAVDSENNFIVSGWLGVTGSSYDWHVRKYASDGTLLWQTSYDLKGNTEAAIDVAVDSEDNIIVIGYRNDGTDEGAGIARDWYMVKYAKDGNGMGDATVLWEQAWNSGKTSASYVARTLLIDGKDNVYVGGEQPNNSDTVSRSLVQYRDGQTGTLIRSQDIGHPVTVRGEAGTAGNENDYIKDLALNGDQLVVVGQVWEGYFLNGRTAWISMFKLLPDVGSEDWSSHYVSTNSPYNTRFYGVDFLANDTLLVSGYHPGAGIGIRYAVDTGIPKDDPAEWIEESSTQFNQQFIGASGNIYFANFDGRTYKYASDGTSAADWPINTGITTYDVAEDSAGNVYVVGGSTDWKIHKYASNGTSVGGAFPITYDHGGLNDYVYRVAVDSEDNFIVTGPVMQDEATDPDHWDWLVRKYSSDGTTVLWEKTVDGGGFEDHPAHILIDSMDNVLVSGRIHDGRNHNAYIVKYAKSDGSLLWDETVDSSRSFIADRMLFDAEENIYVAMRVTDVNNLWRYHVHYRDGSNGSLLKSQEISYPTTHHDNPNDESNDGAPYIALNNGQLLIAGFTVDRTNPPDYKNTAFVVSLNRTFVVTSSSGENGSIVPDTILEDIAYQGSVEFTANADSNYHVASISGCGINYTNTSNLVKSHSETTSAVTADCTVIATFAMDMFFDVTSSVTGNGTIAPSTVQAVGFNETITFTLAPDDHHHIVDISGTCPIGDPPSPNGPGTWGYTTGAITEDCTVIANFGMDPLKVTPSTDGNGTADPSSVSNVDYNTRIEFALYPNATYHPESVGGTCPAGSLLDNTDGTWTYTSGLITIDCTVDFSFDNTFDVTPSSKGLGSIDPSAVVVNVIYGNTVEFTLTPTSDQPPEPVTGTCPVGTLIDEQDGTWTYTTGAIVEDCTVIATFEDDTTFFMIPVQGNKAVIFGL